MAVSRKLQIWVGLMLLTFLLVGCAQPMTETTALVPVDPTLLPAETETPQADSTAAGIEMYEPLSTSICQMLQQEASRA